MKKFLSTGKKTLLLFFLICVTAFGIRYLRVTFEQQPIFGDEAIYVRWSQVMKAEPTLRFLPLSDGKQPFYMWILMFLLKPSLDPLIVGRLLSVVTGLGTFMGVFILSYLLFKSQKVSLIAALIYAISPFLVFFDSMALTDSLLTMFGVWVAIFAILAARYVRADFAMLAGLALGAALLTKSPALYFAILLPVAAVFAPWPKHLAGKVVLTFKLGGLFLAAYSLAVVMYNIQRLGPNFQMLALRNSDYVYPLSHFLTSPLDPLKPFLNRSLEWLWIWGPSTLVVLVFAGIFLNLKKYFKEVLVIAAWAFLPIFVSAEFAKVFTARYILFTLPFLSILAAAAFLSDKYKLFLKVFLLIFIVHALLINWKLVTNITTAPIPRSERSGYLEEWTSGYGIKDTANYISAYHAKYPTDKIVVGTEGYFGTLPDGLQIYLNKYPEITVIGVGLDLTEVPKSLKESKAAGNTTFLVINDSRLKAKPESIGLRVLAAYPKAFRQQNTVEYNLLGPRETLYLFEVK